ncbi:hypothetical protein Cal7507_1816 [Calothrix sp. PCC 7507]|nr:hypothetical protein Cal7507_1816 [Calothrix sp. PCC 7507]
MLLYYLLLGETHFTHLHTLKVVTIELLVANAALSETKYN